MIWQFCVVGTKAAQIEAEMKKAYEETHQALVRRVTAAYKRGEGSDKVLQELLKNLPIPAKFTKQPTGQVTEPPTDSPKSAQQPPKIDVSGLPNGAISLQGPNLNTKQPPGAGESLGKPSGELSGESLGEAVARSLQKKRTPLEASGSTISSVFNHIDPALQHLDQGT